MSKAGLNLNLTSNLPIGLVTHQLGLVIRQLRFIANLQREGKARGALLHKVGAAEPSSAQRLANLNMPKCPRFNIERPGQMDGLARELEDTRAHKNPLAERSCQPYKDI
jgi:hypothetical protein